MNGSNTDSTYFDTLAYDLVRKIFDRCSFHERLDAWNLVHERSSFFSLLRDQTDTIIIVRITSRIAPERNSLTISPQCSLENCQKVLEFVGPSIRTVCIRGAFERSMSFLSNVLDHCPNINCVRLEPETSFIFCQFASSLLKYLGRKIRTVSVDFKWSFPFDPLIMSYVAEHCTMLHTLHYVGPPFADIPQLRRFWPSLLKNIRVLNVAICRNMSDETTKHFLQVLQKYATSLTVFEFAAYDKFQFKLAEHLHKDLEAALLSFSSRIEDAYLANLEPVTCRKILEASPCLRRVSIDEDKVDLERVLLLRDRIHELSLRISAKMDVSNVFSALSYCTNMKRLRMYFDSNPVPGSICSIFKCSFGYLEVLRIRADRAIMKREELESIARATGKLEEIRFECLDACAEGITCIAQYNPELLQLQLGICSGDPPDLNRSRRTVDRLTLEIPRGLSKLRRKYTDDLQDFVHEQLMWVVYWEMCSENQIMNLY